MSKYPDVLDGFSEPDYLGANPDVREAVTRGEFKSGWHHFITFGFRERRKGVSDAFMVTFLLERDAVEASSPPPHLRKRVHGVEDFVSFDAVGKVVSGDILAALKAAGLSNIRNILDFGCGCGRVMKHLRPSFPNARMTGSDIDPEAIAWCSTNLGSVGTFAVNEALPPLPFADRQFDFVYGISVFTHLPEDMQFSWLKELRRITVPGGYLLLTTHGETAFGYAQLQQAQVEKFDEDGFYYLPDGSTDGLPDFYRNAFHKHWYIQQHWGKVFDILRIVDKGINAHQDLILCKVPA